MKHLSGNGKQQVIADGNPYLRVYCILAGPVERLDVQMLLDLGSFPEILPPYSGWQNPIYFVPILKFLLHTMMHQFLFHIRTDISQQVHLAQRFAAHRHGGEEIQPH